MTPYKELSPDGLYVLYQNFIIYRDKHCDGMAKISVRNFYIIYALREYKNDI